MLAFCTARKPQPKIILLTSRIVSNGPGEAQFTFHLLGGLPVCFSVLEASWLAFTFFTPPPLAIRTGPFLFDVRRRLSLGNNDQNHTRSPSTLSGRVSLSQDGDRHDKSSS
ncbi:hypothetical protein QC762_0042900 [Podospora pseudocomata]|uniref:Uncharacterized protein n=1 Tax=Podospora pseudocomata TaxID=2093779 RepID=A0ABR0GN13_9PEZI|nr:hypothetical protein QC762_0042900 [Podospora pseudocomata]